MIQKIKTALVVLAAAIMAELLHRNERRHWAIEAIEDALLVLIFPVLVVALLVKRKREARSNE